MFTAGALSQDESILFTSTSSSIRELDHSGIDAWVVLVRRLLENGNCFWSKAMGGQDEISPLERLRPLERLLRSS